MECYSECRHAKCRYAECRGAITRGVSYAYVYSWCNHLYGYRAPLRHHLKDRSQFVKVLFNC
jgi:hypothetical protein